MPKKNNPCLRCYFDWKDACSDEKRKKCIESMKKENTKDERNRRYGRN